LTSHGKRRFTDEFILEKYHQYLEEDEEYELRTGKTRKSFSYKEFVVVARECEVELIKEAHGEEPAAVNTTDKG
ncbi:hypothetical protein RYX36_010659, partial [Vicia faba]